MEIVVEQILVKENYTVIRYDGNGYFVWDGMMQSEIKRGDIKVGSKILMSYVPGKYPKVKAWKILGQQTVSQAKATTLGSHLTNLDKASEQLEETFESDGTKITQQPECDHLILPRQKVVKALCLLAAAVTIGPIQAGVQFGKHENDIKIQAERYLEWL